MDFGEKFLVCIRCMTYNQSAYITDALDGFCMQQTDFPFYVVVFDDASIDGEQKIIKTYLDEHCDQYDGNVYKQWERDEAYYTFAQHLENKNCHFLVAYLKKNLYKTPRKSELIKEWCVAKYMALCEGDDYWTDPLKLQRQVDFLEEHEEYSASTENGRIHFLADDSYALFSEEKTRDVPFDDLLIRRRFPTASVVYRSCYSLGLSRLTPPGFDTQTWAYLATQGKIHFNSVVSSVYRRGCGITSNDRIRWAYTVRGYNHSLNNNFEISDEIKKIRNEDVYFNIVNGIKEAWKQRRYVDFLRLSCYGAQIHPKRMFKFLIGKK